MGSFWNATVTIRRQTLSSAFYGYGSNIITRSDHVSNDVWRARNLSASYIYILYIYMYVCLSSSRLELSIHPYSPVAIECQTTHWFMWAYFTLWNG